MLSVPLYFQIAATASNTKPAAIYPQRWQEIAGGILSGFLIKRFDLDSKPPTEANGLQDWEIQRSYHFRGRLLFCLLYLSSVALAWSHQLGRIAAHHFGVSRH